jgi:valyl-tRNA synthetase
MEHTMSETKKTYDPHAIENDYYRIWEERGYFEVDGNAAIQQEGKAFTISMPPPNVTGTLHMGHALQDTIMDALRASLFIVSVHPWLLLEGILPCKVYFSV